MKKVKFIFLILTCIVIFYSCEKDETRVIIKDNPTAPVIKSPTDGTSFIFSQSNDNQYIVFIWSRADFGFKASLINTLQIQKKDGDFKKAKQFFVKPANKDTISVTYKELNTALVGLGLPKNQKDTVLVRVQTILEKVDTVFSPTIRLLVTPY